MSAPGPGAPAGGSPPAPSGPPRVGHLGAIDVVRFVTVAGVIVVHTTSLTAARSSLAAGGVLSVFHVTRSVFLFLSAFVLTYSFQRRPLAARAFWRRRYPLVAAPYVVWSAIYVLTDGELHKGPVYVVEHFVLDLFDGGAHFHLYFLLLTFQLYLIFPPLIRWLAARPALHWPLLWASVAFQLGFTAAIHYGWRPPVLGIWFTHAGSWLPSYVLYIVGGLIGALHFEEVTGWVRTHSRVILAAFVASVALAEVSFLCDLHYLGYAPIRASGVFQPTVTIEGVTSTLAQYALGLWVIDRVADRGRRFLERSADVSFGVYLAHPLLVGGILDVAALTGLSAAVGHLPGGAVEGLVVAGLVPSVYAVTFWGIARIRRTPASLWLTGRRAPRRAAPQLTTATASPPVV